MGKHYDQLSLDERCEIYRLHADGKSLRAIARAVARAPSTICRELERNSGSKVGYKVEWAMIQSRARRRRKLYKLERSSALRDVVLDGLAMGWSPEQIAGRLERDHARPIISHESIYRYIYWRVANHKDYLHRLLPRAKFLRGWRGRKGGGGSARFISGRVPLSERPKTAANRRQLGHWEGDLMLFSRYSQAVLVAHERTSRLTLMRIQPNKAANPLADSLISMLEGFSIKQRRTMTFDNGSEFSEHHRLAELGMTTYFCDTHSPWQKGGVENAIGRVRRYLPRKTDINATSQETLDEIVLNYNLTPRRCLNFRTPLEAFLGKDINLGVALEM